MQRGASRLWRRRDFGAVCLDVRTLTFCQLMGVSIKPQKLNFWQGSRKQRRRSWEADAPSARLGSFRVRTVVRPAATVVQLSERYRHRVLFFSEMLTLSFQAPSKVVLFLRHSASKVTSPSHGHLIVTRKEGDTGRGRSEGR